MNNTFQLGISSWTFPWAVGAASEPQPKEKNDCYSIIYQSKGIGSIAGSKCRQFVIRKTTSIIIELWSPLQNSIEETLIIEQTMAKKVFNL